jgi:hypothetical protein
LIAVRNGHNDVLRLLLGLDGIDPNARNSQGDFALIVAVQMNNEQAVQLLCNHHAININQEDSAGVILLVFERLFAKLLDLQIIPLRGCCRSMIEPIEMQRIGMGSHQFLQLHMLGHMKLSACLVGCQI